MSEKSPVHAQTFLACREIWQNAQGEYLLVGVPFIRITVGALPALVRFSLYISLTGGHDSCRLRLELRGSDGTIVADCTSKEPIPKTDPAAGDSQIAWRDLVMPVVQAGKYDLVLLADGDELARRPLEILFTPTVSPSAGSSSDRSRPPSAN